VKKSEENTIEKLLGLKEIPAGTILKVIL